MFLDTGKSFDGLNTLQWKR